MLPTMKRIIQFCCDRPALLLIGGWSLLIMAGSFAALSLVSFDQSERSATSPEPPEPKPFVTSSETTNAPPLWSVGAIAAGCIIGSLLISQRWQPPKTLRQWKSDRSL